MQKEKIIIIYSVKLSALLLVDNSDFIKNCRVFGSNCALLSADLLYIRFFHTRHHQCVHLLICGLISEFPDEV